MQARTGKAARPVNRTLGLLAVVVAVVGFSVSSSVVKWAGVSGPVIAFWRVLAAVAVWWLIARWSGQQVTWQNIRKLWLSGILFGLNLAVFFLAVTRTSIAHAEFIGALTPLLLVPAGAVLFHERVAWGAMAWGSLAIVGVAVVLFNGPASSSATISGDLLVVLAVLLWAAYLLSAKRARSHMDVATFMASIMPVGTLTLLPIALASGAMFEVTTRGWVAVAVLLVTTGVGAHGLMFFAQRHVPVGTISMIQVAQPALAVVWAYLLLGESIRPIQTLGMALVVVGLTLFTLRSARRKGPVTVPPPGAAATIEPTTDGELAGPAG